MSTRRPQQLPPALSCLGCTTFECTDSWTLTTLALDKDQAVLWLNAHLLVWPSITCAKISKHEKEFECQLKRRQCSLLRNCLAWICPECHSKSPAQGPLLTSDGQKSPIQVLILIYLFVHGSSPDSIARETQFRPQAIRDFRAKIEAMVSWAHVQRFEDAKGTARYLQKDETFFSKVKRGGCGKGKRVRESGPTAVHTLVITNPMDRARQVFMIPVANLKAETLNPHVHHLAMGPTTQVRTDGARSNYALGEHFIWEPCNHKEHWVAPEGHPLAGHHTQTVECMHSHVKRALAKCGGNLGRDDVSRGQRIQFLAEIVNGSLVFCKSTKLRRIFSDLSLYSQSGFIVDED